MLAAVGGVAYTLAVVLKLQSYLGYLQPMPIIVAAMRWGPGAARKTMTATSFLLLGALLPLSSACCIPCTPVSASSQAAEGNAAPC